jgi:MFS family permease
MVVPLYIGEISPPEIRGSLLVFEALFVVFGIVVAFWITYGTKDMSSNWSWQLPFVLQMVPGVILGFGATLLPYSPRWLASKGREEEALHSLAKLRRLPESDSRVHLEWMHIITEARFQSGVLAERHPDLRRRNDVIGHIKLEVVSWLDCFKAGCWRRTMVGVLLMFFQQFLGIFTEATPVSSYRELTAIQVSCVDLLLPYAVWHHGLGFGDATYHVWGS